MCLCGCRHQKLDLIQRVTLNNIIKDQDHYDAHGGHSVILKVNF